MEKKSCESYTRCFTVPFGSITAQERIKYYKEGIARSPIKHLFSPDDIENSVLAIEKEGDKYYPLLPLSELLPITLSKDDAEVIEVRNEGGCYNFLYLISCHDEIVTVYPAAVDVCWIETEGNVLLDIIEFNLKGEIVHAA